MMDMKSSNCFILFVSYNWLSTYPLLILYSWKHEKEKEEKKISQRNILIVHHISYLLQNISAYILAMVYLESFGTNYVHAI